MRNILNRLILLLYFCAIIFVVKILIHLLSSKPFTPSDVFEGLAMAIVLWIAILLFSKGKFLKDWPFKDQQ
jgi:hypothetical protein